MEPSGRNGLRQSSQLMVDKLFTVPVQAVGEVVGQLEPQVLVDLDLALRGWLALAVSCINWPTFSASEARRFQH